MIAALTAEFTRQRLAALNPNDLRRYRETIAKSVVFEQLESGDVDLILSSCRLLDTAAGGFILTEGLPSDGLYIILEGQIEFLLPEHAGGGLRRPSRIRLNVLGPGRCFGEYGVIDDRPASASAQALAPARLCFLPKAEFRRVIAQNDRIGKIVLFNLLRFLVGRLRGKDAASGAAGRRCARPHRCRA